MHSRLNTSCQRRKQGLHVPKTEHLPYKSGTQGLHLLKIEHVRGKASSDNEC